MGIEPLEVYSEDSNYAVVRTPGRSFPGCVIQGDSLSILFGKAKRIAEAVKYDTIDDDDFKHDLQELNEALLGRLLHYQDVLSRHGINLPYVRAFTKQDLVQLVPDDSTE